MSDRRGHVKDSSILKRTLVALDRLQAKLGETEQAKREPVAIIGMGCRFPAGVHSPGDFWRLLCDEVDTISDIPAERWDADAFYDADPQAPGKMCTRKGSFVADVDKFDPMFFRISPREARGMDPQQRFLLEVGWEALEDAGQANSRLAGSQTGVFIGIMSQDYARRYEQGGDLRLIDAHYSTGNDFSFASGRLSYTFGLQGPSIAINTACSSSLVAVHLACQSLRTGECDMALAGGVSLILSPEINIFLSKAGAMAPDGRCKTFDEAADGMGRGEGCGVVVLKRLSAALADGDRILALIRGCAVNHGGSSGGLTVPNGQAQQALIRQALLNAQVTPSQVSYIEAHGTGTILGDPIEIQSLNTVLSEGRTLNQPVVVGSVKANIGHLDAAAGIASLIKVVLMLQHAEIPRHLHLKQLNTRIPWSDIPLVVPTKRSPWLTNNDRHLAGVSSFGMSGTNAHVVVGEAPEGLVKAETMKLPEREYHILALSAHTETALWQLAGRYATWLGAHPHASLGDVAYTLGIGRVHLEERATLVVDTVSLAQQLLSQLEQGDVSGLWRGHHTSKPKVAWVFTGQGSQYVGMGRELYESLPVVREMLDHCAGLFGSDPGLLEVLFGEQEELLDHTRYTQPALFALEVALAQQLRSWNLEPDVVLGYSVGQYAAAVVAGVLSLEDGLRLIAKRGELMASLPAGGAMAAVFTDMGTVEALLAAMPSLSLAADNGSHLVLSGPTEALLEALLHLKEQGIRTQVLNTSQAFHSALLAPALAEVESFATEVPFQLADKTLICNLTGEVLASGQVLDAGYWRRHSREPVQFARSLRTAAELGVGVVVEVGPQPVLLGIAAQGWPEGKERPALVATLRPGHSEVRQLAEMMAQLYVQGLTPNFGAWHRPWHRRKLALPTYPFQRRSYYLDHGYRRGASAQVLSAPQYKLNRTTTSTISHPHPLQGVRIDTPSKEQLWEFCLSLQNFPEVLDTHAVLHIGHYKAMLAGVLQAPQERENAICFEHVEFKSALTIPENTEEVVTLCLEKNQCGAARFRIHTKNRVSGDWNLHMHGSGRIVAAPARCRCDLDGIRARLTQEEDG